MDASTSTRFMLYDLKSIIELILHFILHPMDASTSTSFMFNDSKSITY